MAKEAIMNNQSSKSFPCRDCGTTVWWDVNRNGKKYLANTAEWNGTEGGFKSFKVPHHCSEVMKQMHKRQLEAEATMLAQAVANGEIVKGQTVEVFKGRKIPIGTTGVVFWVATENDTYGNIRIGFSTDNGDKHFTNITNVRAKQTANCQ
jgi:hypothetical protein